MDVVETCIHGIFTCFVASGWWLWLCLWNCTLSKPSAIASFREKQKQGLRSMATQCHSSFLFWSFDVCRFFTVVESASWVVGGHALSNEFSSNLLCLRRRKLTEPTEAYHRQALRLQTSAFYVGLSSKLVISSWWLQGLWPTADTAYHQRRLDLVNSAPEKVVAEMVPPSCLQRVFSLHLRVQKGPMHSNTFQYYAFGCFWIHAIVMGWTKHGLYDYFRSSDVSKALCFAILDSEIHCCMCDQSSGRHDEDVFTERQRYTTGA